VGRKFTEVVNTPGSLSLPASAAPIQVTCTSKGYRPATAKLDSSANGWMAGNVLFGLLGGGIGLLVDAASGAGQQFPPKFSILLEPERFASIAQRDQWYSDRETAVKSLWENAITTKTQQCRQMSYSTNDIATASCRASIKTFEEQRDNEIKRLEEGKAAAVISPPDASTAPATPPAAPAATRGAGQTS